MYISRITEVIFLFEPKPQYFPEPNQVLLVPQRIKNVNVYEKLLYACNLYAETLMYVVSGVILQSNYSVI